MFFLILILDAQGAKNIYEQKKNGHINHSLETFYDWLQ